MTPLVLKPIPPASPQTDGHGNDTISTTGISPGLVWSWKAVAVVRRSRKAEEALENIMIGMNLLSSQLGEADIRPIWM